MSSVLNVDTIADKAGTGPVGLTKQSAAKVWCHWTETTSTALQQSLNVSGVTDNGTGLTTVAFTSSLSYDDYAVTAGAQGFNDGSNDNNAPVMMLHRDETNPRTTGDVDFMNASRNKTTGTGMDDAAYASTAIHGDLA